MPALSFAVPKYRKPKPSGQAVVTLAGQDHYLGPHGTRVSRQEYDRLVGEWLAAGRPVEPAKSQQITVTEVIAAFWRHAKAIYVKHGRPTGAHLNYNPALKLLRQRYGRTKAVEFGPLGLKALQVTMVEKGHSRRYVNDNTHRIRKVFKWAASEQLVPASVHQALQTVDGLRKGASAAKESTPIGPVAEAIVDKTLPFLPKIVADMVRLQRLTGARPGGICSLRPCDLDRHGLRMAADVHQAHEVSWSPGAAGDGGDAYAVVRYGDHSARLRGLEYVRRNGPEGSRRRQGREFLRGAVGRRAESAYASAALFRGGLPGDVPIALRLANEVVADLDVAGRLHSTADSAAAIALLNELQVRRLLGNGSLLLNGRLCIAADALALVEQVQEVAAEEGTIALEVTRTTEEDWESAAAGNVAVHVALERSGEPRRRLSAGDAAELIIRLPNCYQMGDLAWVCLPAALARLSGGGQIKRFAVDFAGQCELRIPLAATGSMTNVAGQRATEHVVVRVRNSTKRNDAAAQRHWR